MKTFFLITTKHWKSIAIITLLTIISAVGFGYLFNRDAYATTVFINVGAKSKPGISTFETVQAADAFSESVMGWFKNPGFTEKVSAESGIAASMSARKQEKQNLIVTYKTETSEQGAKISSAIESNLRSEISLYDSTTSNDFNIALFNSATAESKTPPTFFAVMGLVAGLILGYGLLALFDRFKKALHEYRH
jgi:capsular polysaccharide biosynthesis protein